MSSPGLCRFRAACGLALAVLFAGVGAEARTRRAPSALRDFSATVIKVLDGDSLIVRKGVDEYDVRLARVDAPELRQRRGDEAKRYTEARLLGHAVLIRAKTLDTYGRLIGEVSYRGGRSFNEDLVAAGWAWWYKRHYPRDLTMGGLERQARERRAGLWQDKSPTPPWTWRKQNAR